MKAIRISVLSCAVTLAALAVSAKSLASECVSSNSLSGYTVVDDQHLLYKTDFHESYLMTLSGGCDLKGMDFPIFEEFSAMEICAGDTVKTYEQGIGETGFCVIDAITKQ